MKRVWSGLWCLVLVSVVGAQTISGPFARAQSTDTATDTPKGLTISPPIQEIILGSGLIEAQARVSIANTTGQDLVADIRVVDFDTSDQFGALAFLEPGNTNSKYGLANWMKVTGASTVSLLNGRTTDIPFIITNGIDLSPGGHYAAVIASVSTPPGGGANTVSLKQELVSLVLAKKIGGETYGLELEGLKLDQSSRLPAIATTTFKSTGNVHVIPRGYIEVRDGDNRLLAKGIINPESSSILPDKSRQFDTTLQVVDKPGKSKKYTVTAFYRYDGQEKFSTNSVVLTDTAALKQRYAVAGVLIAGIIAVLFIIRSVIRKRKIRNS